MMSVFSRVSVASVEKKRNLVIFSGKESLWRKEKKKIKKNNLVYLT